VTTSIIIGDCIDRLKSLRADTFQCCVTSPPYFRLRDYKMDGQIGLEKTPEQFIEKLVHVFREVHRVLKKDGTLWINFGDSYGDDKQLLGMPWRVALALQADGWYLRADIIWAKPNPMPESVLDRPTKAHEYIFLMTKSPQYYYDAEAIKESATTNEGRPPGVVRDREYGYDSKQAVLRNRQPVPKGWDTSVGEGGHGSFKRDKQRGHSRKHTGLSDKWDKMDKVDQCAGMRNKRSVWNIATQPFKDAHFATFPTEIPEICIKAGSRAGDLILDPFGGAGTTGLVAERLQRDCVLIELNPDYAAMARDRIDNDAPLFSEIKIKEPDNEIALL